MKAETPTTRSTRFACVVQNSRAERARAGDHGWGAKFPTVSLQGLTRFPARIPRHHVSLPSLGSCLNLLRDSGSPGNPPLGEPDHHILVLRLEHQREAHSSHPPQRIPCSESEHRGVIIHQELVSCSS